MSNRTERLRPVVCADVEPRHALQIEEAEEHAQYVTDNDTAEEIALPMVDFVVDALVIIFRFFKKFQISVFLRSVPVLHLPQHIERGMERVPCSFETLSTGVPTFNSSTYQRHSTIINNEARAKITFLKISSLMSCLPRNKCASFSKHIKNKLVYMRKCF